MSETRWEHFAHEADMGVRGFGESKAEAFEQAALAMTAVITDLEKLKPNEVIDINCEAPDDELLFVDWLNALVYEMSTRNMLFSRFEVHIEGQKLTGKAWGEKVDVVRHQPAVEVKGATYTALKVSQDRVGNWLAQCIVDV
jgi:protein archease